MTDFVGFGAVERTRTFTGCPATTSRERAVVTKGHLRGTKAHQEGTRARLYTCFGQKLTQTDLTEFWLGC